MTAPVPPEITELLQQHLVELEVAQGDLVKQELQEFPSDVSNRIAAYLLRSGDQEALGTFRELVPTEEEGMWDALDDIEGRPLDELMEEVESDRLGWDFDRDRLETISVAVAERFFWDYLSRKREERGDKSQEDTGEEPHKVGGREFALNTIFFHFLRRGMAWYDWELDELLAEGVIGAYDALDLALLTRAEDMASYLHHDLERHRDKWDERKFRRDETSVALIKEAATATTAKARRRARQELASRRGKEIIETASDFTRLLFQSISNQLDSGPPGGRPVRLPRDVIRALERVRDELGKLSHIDELYKILYNEISEEVEVLWGIDAAVGNWRRERRAAARSIFGPDAAPTSSESEEE